MRTQGGGDLLGVGLTYIQGTVAGPSGTTTLELLIDTGAEYTLLPDQVWRHLGLRAKRTMGFHLADGTRVERAVSECHITVGEREGHTPVILGEPGDVALFGAVTFEILRLVFSPFDRSLRPMTSAPLMRLVSA